MKNKLLRSFDELTGWDNIRQGLVPYFYDCYSLPL